MKIEKHLFLISILFFSLQSFCQEAQDTSGSFISKNGSVYWTHKFDKSFSFTNLLNTVKRANILTNLDTFQNTIIGQSIEGFMDYRGAGFSGMSTPIFLSNSSFKSSVIIEKYDSSYVVTIKKITFINQNDTKQISSLFGSAQGETNPLEDYALKKTGKFRNSFLKPTSKIIDYTFMKLYAF